ncbi:MAG: hypothetical protein Q9191_008454 [Dirinaria sp. TL-2023a]
MATPTPPAPSETAQSFTTMDKDLEAIGAHCQYSYCNQLDFLPFRCESCRGTYCLEHRTESAHRCVREGEWARRKKNLSPPTTSTSATGNNSNNGRTISSVAPAPQPSPSQCSLPECKTVINTHNSVGVGCDICMRQYCLKHRLREDHSCATLQPAPRQQLQSVEKARSALGRLKLWSKERQASLTPNLKPKPFSSSSSTSSTTANRILALNNLKKTAKGDAKVPPEKRIYLHVEAEASSTSSKLPSGAFWFSKEWSVGRLLDVAARGLQVENLNNRGGGEEARLRVFHVEGGRLLEFGELAGDVLGNGNTVVLLRGVGNAASAADADAAAD